MIFNLKILFIIAMFSCPQLVFANCKMLYNKTEAIDMLDDGTEFPIVSIHKIGNTYGDNSMLEAIAIKKSALPKSITDLKKLSIQIAVMAGSDDLYKQNLKQKAAIKGHKDYILFPEFNKQGLKNNVYEPLNKANKLKEQEKPVDIKTPTGIFISVLNDSKRLCVQELGIDFH